MQLLANQFSNGIKEQFFCSFLNGLFLKKIEEEAEKILYIQKKEMIKNDNIEVISKYMEIDTQGLDIQITQTESDGNNGTVPALYANIPIRDLKHKE